MNKLQQLRLSAIRHSKKIATVAAGTALTTSQAMAALPAEATAALTEVSGSVTDIFGAVWPIVGTVTAGFILIRLFRKGANAAV